MSDPLVGFWENVPSHMRRMWKTYVERQTKVAPTEGEVSARDAADATTTLRAQIGSKVTGKPHDAEIDAACVSSDWPAPRLSPHADNILEGRPYFGVPLDDAGMTGQTRTVLGEIAAFFKGRKNVGRPVTDVFIMSHGWHRNLFTGASAYDRLMARFSLLFHRGVLEAPNGFSPLFIGLQWISDPGPGGFIDPAGRRNKQSFLDNVVRRFEPVAGHAAMLTQFEEMFVLLSRSCAPESPPISADDRAEGARLAQELDKYSLREATVAMLSEKIAVLWLCYHEAVAKAVLCDQEDPPAPTATISQAILTTGKFFVGTIGIGVFLGLLTGPLKKLAPSIPSWHEFVMSLQNSREFLRETMIERPLDRVDDWAVFPSLPSNHTFLWIVGAVGIALAYIGAHVAYYSIRGKKPVPGRTPVLLTIAWLIAQIPLTLPIVAFVLVTLLLRSSLPFLALFVALIGYPGIAAWILLVTIVSALYMTWRQLPASAVYRERLIDTDDRIKYSREYLAALARLPINWIKRAAAPDSLPVNIAKALDNQFAFFEMQRKGVEVGDEAAEFVHQLVKTIEASPDVETSMVRLHFIGHSFGGLVTLNALRGLLQRLNPPAPRRAFARALADYGTTVEQSKSPVEIRSLTLIQSATASDWFATEKGIVEAVTGSIGCIFSRYDTANGFWYPLANNGRMAAGFVGLCNMGEKGKTPATMGKGDFIMLVRPPKLGLQAPCQVNLDSSRIIYEGAIPTGGGHDDIFKDDVLNLVWSAVTIPDPPAQPTPPASPASATVS